MSPLPTDRHHVPPIHWRRKRYPEKVGFIWRAHAKRGGKRGTIRTNDAPLTLDLEDSPAAAHAVLKGIGMTGGIDPKIERARFQGVLRHLSQKHIRVVNRLEGFGPDPSSEFGDSVYDSLGALAFSPVEKAPHTAGTVHQHKRIAVRDCARRTRGCPRQPTVRSRI